MKPCLLSTIKGKNITELNWWDNEVVSGSSEQSKSKVGCVPAPHYGGRSLEDENARLSSGWMVKGATQTLYHAGDTGYCNVFKRIGKQYGPIDVVLIPIGAYCPR